MNGLVAALIGFIYSPRTVTVRCDDGSSAQVELDEEDVARIVLDPRFLDLVERFAPDRLAEARSALEVHYAKTRQAGRSRGAAAF